MVSYESNYHKRILLKSQLSWEQETASWAQDSAPFITMPALQYPSVFLPLLLPKGQVQMPLRNALCFLLFQPEAQVLNVREWEEMKGLKLCGLVSMNQRVQTAPEPIQGHRDRSLVPLSPFCPLAWSNTAPSLRMLRASTEQSFLPSFLEWGCCSHPITSAPHPQPTNLFLLLLNILAIINVQHRLPVTRPPAFISALWSCSLSFRT